MSPVTTPDPTNLDLETKVRLLTGATSFTLAPEPSIGLGEIRLSDGPTGVRGLKFTGGRQVALFPNATLLASAWSEETTHEVGRLLAEEAIAQQIHVVLGPTINLHRSPLGGRLFEAYSEDPLLSGLLAAAYVRGMQELGVGACLKHLVANESETDRHTVDSVVDEVTLRELYLLPFEIAVAESDPWTAMAAYNDVNGVAATEQQHVNTAVLKGEWGWTGLLMSDWFATKTAAPAANGGLDLVMPGPRGPWGEALVQAVRSGAVEESVIDEHLSRLVVLADRVGALGTPREWPTDVPEPGSAVRREQLTRLAAAGMTVLTNRAGTDTGTGARAVLPLAAGTTVALIGRHALETIDMGGGSAQVNPPYQVSVAQGLTAMLGNAVTVTDGVEVRSRPAAARPGFVVDPESGDPGIEVTLSRADGSVILTRSAVPAVTAVGFDDDFDDVVASVRLRARLPVGGEVEVGASGVGSWSVRVGDQHDTHELAVSGHGFGEEMISPPTGTALYRAGDGEVVEAVREMPAPAEDGEAGGAGGAFTGGVLGLLARPVVANQEAVLAEAVRAASAADVAVVVVGLTEEQETESVDKSTLRLPGEQDAMVSAVAAAARRTVVVVNAATPVLMPWLGEVDAVLWAGLPGQEGGHAVAAALLGHIEPAGRLVTTFPSADGASPAWSVTPVDGKLRYTEGTSIGYRGHDAGLAPAPAFWLGHGLGYASWDYTDVELQPGGLDVAGVDVAGVDAAGLDGRGAGAGDGHAVVVTVTNTGDRPSREVVQLYFRPDAAGQPVRLVGWTAVHAGPGESVTARVVADTRMWRRWDTAANGWGVLPEGGELVLARGLGDVRATLTIPTAAASATPSP